ncbi:hypothetical protein IFO70_02555 [Phormidium tenue FACHB-886]|nr:hypothetical protein [Phormidium tenue FACHB-886]
MRITLERSGGFMGIPMTTSIDTTCLAADEAAQLHQLVEASNFAQLPALIAPTNQPDRFQYRLTVENHEQSQTLSFSESTMPLAVQPLVDWLLKTARQV